MSGHSKWHNIQKTKGAQDAKRAAAFTKISKEMIVAVKEGGGIADPAYNSRLATVITKAKAANMPNDNIKRCLEKAAAAGSGDDYESITYEGHGPAGVAVIVETMTDNRNRTAGNIRHHFDKFGGSLGTSGCVSWSFDKKGVIVIDKSPRTSPTWKRCSTFSRTMTTFRTSGTTGSRNKPAPQSFQDKNSMLCKPAGTSGGLIFYQKNRKPYAAS